MGKSFGNEKFGSWTCRRSYGSYLNFDVKTTGTPQVGLFNETFSEYVSTSVESRQDVLLLIVQTV